MSPREQRVEHAGTQRRRDAETQRRTDTTLKWLGLLLTKVVEELTTLIFIRNTENVT